MKALLIWLTVCATAYGAAYIKTPNTDSLSVSSNPQLISLTNNITIAIWLSKDTNFVGTFENTFISKGGAGFESQFNAGYFFTNRVRFGFLSAAAVVNSTWGTANNGYVARDKIDFFVFSYTFSNTNSMRLLINGVNQSVAWIQTMTNVPPGTDSGALTIGRESTGRRWTGYYSELALWDTILTFDETEKIRKSQIKGMPLQVRPENLMLYLPLDTIPDTQTIPAQKVYPDRRHYGPGALGAGTPIGRAERVCSYQPNE